MNTNEIEQRIKEQVHVTRQEVILAKAYIIGHFNSEPTRMLPSFLTAFEARRPEKVQVNPSSQLEQQVAQVARGLSWQLAFGEAIWNMIGSGILIPQHSGLDDISPSQQWTTVVSGSGTTSSWSFDEFRISVPTRLRLAPSVITDGLQPLANADLYLAEMEIPDLHVEVEDALRQSVKCFSYELYVPCLAMLAKASEGTWLELGYSLLKAALGKAGLKPASLEKIKEVLDDSYKSTLAKMEEVLKLYNRQDIFKPVAEKSGCNQRSLEEVFLWSNVVRDSRNAVHYGADPATQNTYEKVAVLLLNAVPSLRVLYAIRRSAEEIAPLAENSK